MIRHDRHRAQLRARMTFQRHQLRQRASTNSSQERTGGAVVVVGPGDEGIRFVLQLAFPPLQPSTSEDVADPVLPLTGR